MTADPENTEPIHVDLVQEDEQGNHMVVGSFDLTASESLDVNFAEGPNGEAVVNLQVLVGSVEVTIAGQTMTLEAGQPARSLALGAKEVLQGVINQLGVMQAGVANKRDRDNLDAAIAHLTRALDPKFWINALSVQPRDGVRVFQETKNAAARLRQLLADRKSTIADSTLQDLVDRLMGAARMLASVELDEALRVSDASKRVDQAVRERQAGDRDATGVKVESAIEHYRNAWQHAVQ